jgi:hypothetical protein
MCPLIAYDSLFQILFAFEVPDVISANRNSLRCDVIINATRDQNADHSGADIANDTGRAITEPMRHLFLDGSMDANFNEIPNQEVRNSIDSGGKLRFSVLTCKSIPHSPPQILAVFHQKRSAKTTVTVRKCFTFERVDDREKDETISQKRK